MDGHYLIIAIIALWGAWWRDKLRLEKKIALFKKQSAQEKIVLIKTISKRILPDEEIKIMIDQLTSEIKDAEKEGKTTFITGGKIDTNKLEKS